MAMAVCNSYTTSFKVRACSLENTPLRRPSAAPVVKPAPNPSPSPSPSSNPVSTPPTQSPNQSSVSTDYVTIEFQRQRAKELQEYFLDKKFEKQAAENKIFGWTRKNEIGNGRWAMFGIAVGLLTEFATGSSFVDQIKIMVSNLGIAELD